MNLSSSCFVLALALALNLLGASAPSPLPLCSVYVHNVTGDIQQNYGTMNGPAPVPTTQGPYAGVAEDAAAYAASFAALGRTMQWVRFNDMGADAGLSITRIFTAWPATDAALRAADVAALANDTAHYNFSGIEHYVGAAVRAGRSLDFRIGDGFTVSSSYSAPWRFPTNYTMPQGVRLYAAVGAQVARRVFDLFLAQRVSSSQRVLFDLLTETAELGDPFFPGTAGQYAALYAATMRAVKQELGARGLREGVKYVGANTAFSTSPTKRAYFADILSNFSALGPAACPLDAVAFHPFTTSADEVREECAFAAATVAAHFAGPAWPSPPRLASTAWALHGSGMYPMDDGVGGAGYVGAILAAMQDLSLLFSIYYKFDGFNCGNAGAPCLVTAGAGALKPIALPFVLLSRLVEQAGTRRVQAACGAGTSVVAAVPTTTPDSGQPVSRASVFIARAPSAAARPAHLHVPGWPPKPTVLEVETVSVSASGGAGVLQKAYLHGSVRDSDGLFRLSGEPTPYALDLGGAAGGGGGCVALLTLRPPEPNDPPYDNPSSSTPTPAPLPLPAPPALPRAPSRSTSEAFALGVGLGVGLPAAAAAAAFLYYARSIRAGGVEPLVQAGHVAETGADDLHGYYSEL